MSLGLSCWGPNTVQQCLLLPNCMADTGMWEGHTRMRSTRASSPAALGCGPVCTFPSIQFQHALRFVLLIPKCKNIILSGIQTFLLQSNFSILFIFSHMFTSTFPSSPSSPKSSPGTSARRPAALATEPLGSRGARQKGPAVGMLSYHFTGWPQQLVGTLSGREPL